MDEYRDIVETFETDDYKEVSQYLASGKWDLLGVAAGQAEDLSPKFLYCLGRPYVQDDPEEEPLA